MSAVSSSNDIPVCVECGTDEEEISSNKKECTSCEQNIDAPCEMLHDMSISDASSNSISTCANCGKEGSDVTNTCNKCKSVMYCNAACKKKHRSKHKKQCDRRVAELHDEVLFKQPPPQHEDCPICFLFLPILDTGVKYKSCCGKMICSGCSYAPVYDNEGNRADKICPFCRTPAPKTEKEIIERYVKRMDAGDALAMYNIANCYSEGIHGFPHDHKKALELFHRAGELGDAKAYNSIGYAYDHGKGVEVDKKKARHYFELAAIMGDADARYNLGCMEKKAENMDRATKHFMIAAECGEPDSVKIIQKLFLNGHATKEEYSKALRSYQIYLGKIKSVQRDEAAVYFDTYKYY